MTTDNVDRNSGYLDVLLAAVDFAEAENASFPHRCSTTVSLHGKHMDLYESKAVINESARSKSGFVGSDGKETFEDWRGSGFDSPAETKRFDTMKHLLKQNHGGIIDAERASLGVMAELSHAPPQNIQVKKHLLNTDQFPPHLSSSHQINRSYSRINEKLEDDEDDVIVKFDNVTSSEEAAEHTSSIQALGNYVDYSREFDLTPSMPLTAPNRCPSFLVKLYAVLSHQELSHIITWLPHGRSWTLIDPIEFEVSVIPKYFGSGISLVSFTKTVIKQGFRHISLSIDTNPHNKRKCGKSYFHECFLRGKPHLMKRIDAQEKISCDNSLRKGSGDSTSSYEVTTEADLCKFSVKRPLPMDSMPENDESAKVMRMLDKFITERGPNNRVPISLCKMKLGKEMGGRAFVLASKISRKSAAKRKLEQCEAQMAKHPKVFLSNTSNCETSFSGNDYFGSCTSGPKSIDSEKTSILPQGDLMELMGTTNITRKSQTFSSQTYHKYWHVMNENDKYVGNRNALYRMNSLQMQQQNQATVQLDSTSNANNTVPKISSIPVSMLGSISHGQCITIPNQNINDSPTQILGNCITKNLVSQAFVAGVMLGSGSMRGGNGYNSRGASCMASSTASMSLPSHLRAHIAGSNTGYPGSL